MDKDDLSCEEIVTRLLQASIEGAEELYKSKHKDCDHGVVFNEEVANKILNDWEAKSTAEFIMGNPASKEIRKLYPRLNGLCPKGCGYNGIAYASYTHYIMGDY